MTEIAAAVVAGAAAGFPLGAATTWLLWRPRKAAPRPNGLEPQEPRPCSVAGHDKHIKGAQMLDGRKHLVRYCANPACAREWLEPV